MRSSFLIARLRVLLGVMLLAVGLVLGAWTSVMHLHGSGSDHASALAQAHAVMAATHDHAAPPEALAQEVCERGCALASGLLPNAGAVIGRPFRAAHAPEAAARPDGLSPAPTAPPPKPSLG